jgi:4-hydroxyphenylacetate 3-monooxygenase
MAARRGAEFLAGLRDDREVWLNGERVADVTTHPGLAGCAHTLAELYDLQHDPAVGPKLTYLSPSTGAAVSLAFVEPRSVDDLVRRREMFKGWADHAGGMLGRSPDHVSTILAGCAMARSYFARDGAENAERIVAYYEWCRERDLCATHTFAAFRPNRTRSVEQQEDATVPLYIVGESAALLARRFATYDRSAAVARVQALLARSDPAAIRADSADATRQLVTG